jgi:bacillithiol system protein YtxJ
MGLFKNIFKMNTENSEVKASNLNWIPFTSIDQMEEIKALSANETILIFKHSTRCGISRMVLKQFENSFKEGFKDLKVYYIDLLNYREVSNEVGYAFQVQHQSPQLLVIKNGVAVNHASHYEITNLDLK